jgi:hypothetical protein
MICTIHVLSQLSFPHHQQTNHSACLGLYHALKEKILKHNNNHESLCQYKYKSSSLRKPEGLHRGDAMKDEHKFSRYRGL